MNYYCQLTQHGVRFGTHGVIEGPNAFDFILSKKAAAVFGEGGIVVNGVHGSQRQPFGNSDEVRIHLCVGEKKEF